MNEPLLWLAIGTLWLLTLVIGAAVVLLYRYVGAKMVGAGNRRFEQGPAVHGRLASVNQKSVGNRSVAIGISQRRAQLITFISTKCSVCDKAWNEVDMFATQRMADIDCIVIGSGTKSDVFRRAAELSANVTVIDDSRLMLAEKWGVLTTPFTMLVDAQGVVRAKSDAHGLAGYDALMGGVKWDS